MSSPLPAITTDRARSQALAVLLESGALDGALARFLQAQRWFGAKGRAITGLRARCILPLFEPSSDNWFVRLGVDLDGAAAHYQLPLALRAASLVADVPASALVARIHAKDGEVLLLDAVYDAAFRARLGEALARGEAFTQEQTTWRVAPIGASSAALHELPSKLGRAEQSNTSILYGEAAILKLFRRLEDGDNPDVEIGAFLTTRSRFRYVPQLLATIELQQAPGERILAGMLQQLVPSSGDGWSDALAKLRPFVAHGGTTVTFVDEARALGRITRGLHGALADAEGVADFSPERVDDAAANAWVDSVAREIVATLKDLSGRVDSASLAPELVSDVRTLLGWAPRITDRIETIRSALRGCAGFRIRHHGDFHLGQVLRTREGGFVIIDFEGEPSRPLATRRQRHCPLRDVAGMIRSFGYAAAVGRREAEEQGLSSALAAPRAQMWERTVRAAFVDAYFETPPSEKYAFLPASKSATAALLDLFLLEKAFYELRYEINHRPDWLWVPLVGVTNLLEGA